LGEGVSGGCRLGPAGEDGHGGNAFTGVVALEAHVSGDEVGPAGVVGPQQEVGFDSDGVESFGQLAADVVGPLAVGREADDADGSAGPGVARHSLADRAPCQLFGSWGGREIDAGGGEVGADRDEDDRLLWLEAEHVGDGRDQLVGGVDGEAHAR